MTMTKLMVQICVALCVALYLDSRGVYEIQPKAFFGRVIITGPKLKINIQADPSKPKSLEVDFSMPEKITVGDTLPGL